LFNLYGCSQFVISKGYLYHATLGFFYEKKMMEI